MTRQRFGLLTVGLAVMVFTSACGSKDCDLEDPTACGGGQYCQAVAGNEKGMCLDPLEVQGQVFNLETDAPIEGARVTALDVNGAPAGEVATTGADGSYVLRLPASRADEEGTPASSRITLRAAAQDHLTFPGGIRMALPLDLAEATAEGERWILSGSATDVGLAPLPEAEHGRASISGTVELAAGQQGVLVVAETGSGTGLMGLGAVADTTGSFSIFNVPAGSYTVRAYSRGVNYTPADVALAAEDVSGVELTRTSDPTATVAGQVALVAGGAGGVTSVILVTRSTFDADTGRGDAPPGLRAGEVTGAFSITEVPDGEYAVLAAFENDGLVRDPDTSLGGTDVQFATVSGGALVNTLSGFKVTDAIQIVGPGAAGLEVVTENPTFRWTTYPSTARYEVVVFDALGELVWGPETVTPAGAGEVSLVYGGPALEAGDLYQWRATAIATTNQPISRTEDLLGVFRYSP